MARTAGKWEGDSPFIDGVIPVLANSFTATSGTMTFTKNAAGDFSLNAGASQTCVIYGPLDDEIFRTGMQDDSALLENYGTSTPGNAAGAGNAAYTGNQGGPYGVTGRPPFSGATQLTPPVGTRLKGIKILDVTLVYFISGAALTLHTIGLKKTTFANNVANAISDVIAQGANGLATATQANPYVTKVAVAAPTFMVSDLTGLYIEVDATTQVAGAYRLYGAFIHVQYNYN